MLNDTTYISVKKNNNNNNNNKRDMKQVCLPTLTRVILKSRAVKKKKKR